MNVMDNNMNGTIKEAINLRQQLILKRLKDYGSLEDYSIFETYLDGLVSHQVANPQDQDFQG